MLRQIDYNLKAEAQQVKQNLNKQNAIIDAIRQGNIDKAEILSGSKLVSRDPLVQGLVEKANRISASQKQKETNKNNEILGELRAIANKPDVLLEDIKSALTPQLPAPRPTTYDLDRDLDDDILHEYGRPSDHMETGDIEKIKEIYDATLKEGYKLNLLGSTNPKIVKRRKDLVEYRKRLDIAKVAITDLKQQGTSITTTIMTTMNDLVERMKILLGEIESGNTNKVLKNELRDIVHYLYSKDKINRSTYKMLMSI